MACFILCPNPLNEKYQSSPSEEMRCAINLVGKICAEIKSAFEKNKKCEGTQISIQEWLDWLNADVVN